jgi:hypothetical protein
MALAFAWSMPLRDHYLRIGYPHCAALPFAVDTETYHPDPDIEPEDSVGYATHLSFPADPPFAPVTLAILTGSDRKTVSPVSSAPVT